MGIGSVITTKKLQIKHFKSLENAAWIKRG